MWGWRCRVPDLFMETANYLYKALPCPYSPTFRLKTTSMVRVSPAYSAHTPTSVSSPFLKGLGSGTAGGTWASAQTSALRFLLGASERRSDATLAKVLTVWVAFFRSVPRYVRSMKV